MKKIDIHDVLITTDFNSMALYPYPTENIVPAGWYASEIVSVQAYEDDKGPYLDIYFDADSAESDHCMFRVRHDLLSEEYDHLRSDLIDSNRCGCADSMIGYAEVIELQYDDAGEAYIADRHPIE